MEGALSRVLASSASPAVAQKAPVRHLGLAIAAAVALLAVGGATMWLVLRRSEPPIVAKITFEVETPTSPSPNHFALSPDGTRVAAIVGSDRVIWLRAMDSLDSTVLIGTEGATSAFWSPDGRSIAFVANGRLKKVDIAGGAPQTIAESGGGRSFGGASNRDDVIVFGRATGQLFRVPASGGESIPVTELDPARQEVLAFGIRSSSRTACTFCFSPSPPRPRTPGSTWGRSTRRKASNYLGVAVKGPCYVAGAFAVHAGQHVDGAAFRSGPPGACRRCRFMWLMTWARFPATAWPGSLYPATACSRIESGSLNDTVLTWFDRSGKVVGTLGEPARHGGVQLSHDGTRAAVPIVDKTRGTHDIWLYDAAHTNRTRFTFDPGDERTPRSGRTTTAGSCSAHSVTVPSVA